jgi:peroxiredoxin Q/BCP
MYGKTAIGGIKPVFVFVIDEDGIISHALYKVKATGHVAGLKGKLGLGS